jgi:hypothetical protein
MFVLDDDRLPEPQAERKIEKSKDNEIIVLLGLIAFTEIPPNSKFKVKTIYFVWA